MPEPIILPFSITRDDIQGLAPLLAQLRPRRVTSKQAWLRQFVARVEQWNTAQQRTSVATTGRDGRRIHE